MNPRKIKASSTTHPAPHMTTWHHPDTNEEIVPVHRFPAHFMPNKKGHFVQVFLWRYVYQLRSTIPKGAPKKRRTCAYLWFLNPENPFQRKTPDSLGRPVTSRQIGDLHFCLPYLTRAQVAHEAFHATLQLQRWKGLRLANTFKETQSARAAAVEEYLAISHETLSRTLNRELEPYLEGLF